MASPTYVYITLFTLELLRLFTEASSNDILICRAFSTTTSKTDRDQTTTPDSSWPTLCDKCVGSLTSPADHNSEDAGDGAYGL